MKDAKRQATGRHRPFTAEFKAEAVHLVLSTGRPNHVVAPELGIGSSTLDTSVGAIKRAAKAVGLSLPRLRALAPCRARRPRHTDAHDPADAAERRGVMKVRSGESGGKFHRFSRWLITATQ